MATNRSWKDVNGETKENTEFHNIVAWAKLAEICQQILAQGMLVYVEGSLTTRSWDSEDGHTNYRTEIRLDNVIILDSRGKSGAGSDGTEVSAKTPEELLDELESDEESGDSPKKGKSDDKKKKKKEDKEEEDILDDDLPF